MNMLMKILNTAAFAAMILINILANSLPLGGNTTGEVSGSYPNLFTPAPITFAIWGIIYLFAGLYVIFQLGITKTEQLTLSLQQGIRYWFLLSCIANIIWIFLWHYKRIELSMIAMILLLITLIILNINLSKASPPLVWGKLILIGFQIYLGWICAATIANAAVLLTKLGWNRFGFSEQFWTVAIIIVGMILGICLTLAGHRIFASIGIIWAYAGILIKQFSADGYDRAHPLIIGITILAEILMISFIIATCFNQPSTNT